jgi:hypothetical protein
VTERLLELVEQEHVFPESMQDVAHATGIPLNRVEAIEDRIGEFCRRELSDEYESFFGGYR